MQKVLPTGILLIFGNRIYRSRPILEPVFVAPVLRILALILFSGSLFSCSSLYWSNRADDLADVFTAEVYENAYGVSVRAGPLKVGAFYQDPDSPSYGIRGGHAGTHYTGGFTALIFGSDYFDTVPFSQRMKEKSKKAKDESPTVSLFPTGESSDGNSDVPGTGADPVPGQRGKTYLARSPFGTVESAEKSPSLLKTQGFNGRLKDRFAPAYYYTQLEISVAAYYGVTLGINFGELADFILGFFTIDIMDDDAPYPPPGSSIKDSPYFDYLDEDTQKRLLEQEKSGMSPMLLPGGTGPPPGN